MMRNVEWKSDTALMAALQEYSRQNFQGSEVLSFLERDFPQYAWNLHIFDWGLRELKITRVDKGVRVEQLRNAVQQELNGPGKLLGYRTM